MLACVSPGFSGEFIPPLWGLKCFPFCSCVRCAKGINSGSNHGLCVDAPLRPPEFCLILHHCYLDNSQLNILFNLNHPLKLDTIQNSLCAINQRMTSTFVRLNKTSGGSDITSLLVSLRQLPLTFRIHVKVLHMVRLFHP